MNSIVEKGHRLGLNNRVGISLRAITLTAVFTLTLILLQIGPGLMEPTKAQSVPTPAPKQKGQILLQNGVIHIGNGEVVESGAVLITDGKITQAGVLRGRVVVENTIDLQGAHVYPGLIAMVSQIGIEEIEAVRATKDKAETGAINPNARTIVGYNTDSRVTPTLRSNGILLAQIAPQGGLFTGTSSIVHLDAWNWEDAAYLMDDAVHLRWPRLRISHSPKAQPAEKQKKQIMKRLQQINTAMEEAKAYETAKTSGRPMKTDLRWEALVPVIRKEKPLYIYANSEKEIRSALAFMLKHDIRMVLVGGGESWRLTEELKEYKIPVVLRQVHSRPWREDDDLDLPFKTPKILKDAGVEFCLAMESFWNYRNLPFQAGTAAAYGLTKEEALQSITLDAARILGIDSSTGSLEVGKDANLVISTGDLLDMRTHQVTAAYIQGRSIDLGNKQKALYEKYKKKYEGE